jgi:hypothetical protein
VTVDEFQRVVFLSARHSAICDVPQVVRSRGRAVKLRIDLHVEGFVEAYFNEDTGTTAFAWIQNGKRRLGADDTGGWHLHPQDEPDRHVPLERPLSVAEFLSLVERAVD